MGVSYGDTEVAGMPGRVKSGIEVLIWSLLPLKRVPGIRVSVGFSVISKPVLKPVSWDRLLQDGVGCVCDSSPSGHTGTVLLNQSGHCSASA